MTSTDTWIERVRQADADAEEAWRLLGGAVTAKDAANLALIAIAAELRAQRIARRPGAGQAWGPDHPSYDEMGQ